GAWQLPRRFVTTYRGLAPRSPCSALAMTRHFLSQLLALYLKLAKTRTLRPLLWYLRSARFCNFADRARSRFATFLRSWCNFRVKRTDREAQRLGRARWGSGCSELLSDVGPAQLSIWRQLSAPIRHSIDIREEHFKSGTDDSTLAIKSIIKEKSIRSCL